MSITFVEGAPDALLDNIPERICQFFSVWLSQIRHPRYMFAGLFNEMDMPCVVSIQTGINEPRYVGIRGIRKVASVEIPTYTSSDLSIAADSVSEASARVKRVDYFEPELGEGRRRDAGRPSGRKD